MNNFYSTTRLALIALLFFSVTISGQNPVNPLNNKAGVSVNLSQITWTDFDDGSGNGPYDIDFDADNIAGNGNELVWDRGTSATSLSLASVLPLNYNTQYYWWVLDSDIDASGTDGPYHYYSFKTQIEPNQVVITAEPTGTVAVTGQTVSFTYTHVGTASTVKIEVQIDDGSGVATVQTYTNVSSTTTYSNVSLGTLKEGKSYSLNILVTNEDEPTDNYSVAGSGFTTAAFPGSFTASPADGATGVSLSPTFTFATSDAADSYTIEVNTNSSFSGTTIFNGTVGTSGSFDLTSPNNPLYDNTTYYWRFSYNNSASGNSATFGPYSFTTAQQAITTPSNGATGVSISGGQVYFEWGSTSGANQYEIKVGTSPGTYSLTSGNHTSTNANVNHTWQYNQTYYWVVNSQNNAPVSSGEIGDPIQTSNEYNFTTEIATPVITAPTAGSIAQVLNPTITWNFAGGTTGVTFDIQYRAFGSSVWIDATTGLNGTVTSSQLGVTLLYNTAYEVRVVAKKSGESNKPSSAVKFTTLLDTPVLSTPANASTTSSTNPTFSWGMNNSYSNVRFDLLLDTSSPASTVNNSVTGALSMNAASALSSATKYYYKIKATVVNTGDNVGETFTSGSEYYFYTPLVLTAPVNGLTGVAIEPTFTWEDANFESSYKLLISTDGSSQAAFDAAVVRTKTGIAANTTSYTFTEADTSLSNNTIYYWQVVAVDGSNSIKSPIWQFKTWPDMSPTLTNPGNGTTVYTTTTLFSWTINQATGSLKFKPQVVAASSSPSPAAWAAATLTATTTNLNYTFTLNGGTQYYWRLIVLNSSNEVVAYSSEATFTTSGGSSIVPTPSYPIGGETVYTNTPTVYWYLDSYASGLTYQINYSTSNSTSSGELNSGNSLYPSSPGSYSSNLFLTFPSALTPGTTYYWQVRAYYATDGSYSDWSPVQSFVTGGSGTLIIPTPSYPIDGVTVYTSSPTLYWYLNGSGTGLVYDIDYDDTIGGLDGVPEIEDVSSLYRQLSGLTAGKKYYWRVRSDNGTTESNWSSIDSFTVSGGVTGGVAVASWPTGNPTVYTTTPTLSWYLDGSSLGLTGYVLKYSTSSEAWSSFNPGTPDATKGEIAIGSISTTSYTLTTALTNGQTYYWAVASTDGSLESAYSEGSFTVYGGASAGTPALSSPIGGVTVTSTSQTLYWYFNGATGGIVGYDVHYSKDGFLTSDSTITSALSSTNTYANLTGLTPGATYSWKVRAYYGGSLYGSYSTTETFVVDAGAAPVQPLIGGPNNVTITTGSPIVSWVLPVQSESDLTYELVYSTSEDMSSAQVIEGIKTPFTAITGLESGENYYWKVRSKTHEGEYSDYSPRASFSTDQTTAVENEIIIPEKFIVEQNYPNPFNPTTSIKFGLPQSSYVTIKIYNMLGQEVRTLLSSQMGAGIYNLIWDGKDNSGKSVTSGAYIYRVVSGKNVITKKMMLLK